jgi:hypothetical protein
MQEQQSDYVLCAAALTCDAPSHLCHEAPNVPDAAAVHNGCSQLRPHVKGKVAGQVRAHAADDGGGQICTAHGTVVAAPVSIVQMPHA